MSNALDIDRIVREVIKKLHLRFGIKALFVIDQPPQPEVFSQYIRRFNIPWLSINLLFLRELPQAQRRMIEESGLLISSVKTAESIDAAAVVQTNSFLILSDLSVEDSERYVNFQFKGDKDRTVFEFLKAGKDIYYFSEDLTGCSESKPKFVEMVSSRISALGAMGLQLVNPAYELVKGVCDLKTLKQYEGKTVMLAEGTIISPLAQDYIKSGAVNVIRK
ncbi:MAG: hypothetical protein PWP51_1229 [Clostridiales bacterium]|jgi:hypothetical protein|nr:hypothetical protein [Clostridiales bacterium]MDN5298676.1 hypothetical protein [Clostridiales bacterium]